MIIFIICCLRHGSQGFQQIQIWVTLKKFGNRCPSRMVILVEVKFLCLVCRWFSIQHHCCFNFASGYDTFDKIAFYVLFKKFPKPDSDLHYGLELRFTQSWAVASY